MKTFNTLRRESALADLYASAQFIRAGRDTLILNRCWYIKGGWLYVSKRLRCMPLCAFVKHAHVVKKALKAFVCSDFSTAVTHKRLRRACWFIHSFIHSDANPSVKRTGEGVRWLCVFKCWCSQYSNTAETCLSGKLSAQTIKPDKKIHKGFLSHSQTLWLNKCQTFLLAVKPHMLHDIRGSAFPEHFSYGGNLLFFHVTSTITHCF